MKCSAVLIITFLVILLYGVVGDNHDKELQKLQDEVVKKLEKKEKTIKCYTCLGCSDAKQLTSGTKMECKGNPYYGESNKNSPNDDRRDEAFKEPDTPKPLAYYKPLCAIAFGPYGVVGRGCVKDFLEQYSPLAGGGGKVHGKCEDMKFEEGPLNSFTCWCSGNTCNFGSSLHSRIAFVGVAVLGVVTLNVFYIL